MTIIQLSQGIFFQQWSAFREMAWNENVMALIFAWLASLNAQQLGTAGFQKLIFDEDFKLVPYYTNYLYCHHCVPHIRL